MLTITLAATSLGGWCASVSWRLELLAHFRTQYVLAAGLLALYFGLARRWRGALLATAILLANLSSVGPLYLHPESATQLSAQTHQAERLRLLFANVHTANLQRQALLDLLDREGPDLVLLEEIDSLWVASMATMHATYRHQVVESRIDNFGIGVWSRRPLETAEIRLWGEAGIPSIELSLVFQGQALTILLTHPLPPMSQRNAGLRNQQLRTIAGIAKSRGGRRLLLGDLNATPFAPIFHEVLQTSGLLDSSRGFGPQPSWPAQLPWPLRIPIDHCLHSPDLEVVDRRLGPNIGSDHLPLIIDVR